MQRVPSPDEGSSRPATGTGEPPNEARSESDESLSQFFSDPALNPDNAARFFEHLASLSDDELRDVMDMVSASCCLSTGR